MKKFVKGILSILLIVCCLVSAVACGGNKIKLKNSKNRYLTENGSLPFRKTMIMNMILNMFYQAKKLIKGKPIKERMYIILRLFAIT